MLQVDRVLGCRIQDQVVVPSVSEVDNAMPNPSLVVGNSPILNIEGNDTSESLSQLTNKSSSLCNGPVQTKIGFKTSSESTHAENSMEKQDISAIGQWHPLLSAPLGNASGLSASLVGLDEMGAPLDSDAYEKKAQVCKGGNG